MNGVCCVTVSFFVDRKANKRGLAYVSRTQRPYLPVDVTSFELKRSRFARAIVLPMVIIRLLGKPQTLYLGNIKIKEALLIRGICRALKVPFWYTTDFSTDFRAETAIFNFGVDGVLVAGGDVDYFVCPCPFPVVFIGSCKSYVDYEQTPSLLVVKPLFQFNFVDQARILRSYYEFKRLERNQKIITFHPRLSTLEARLLRWYFRGSARILGAGQYPRSKECDVYGAYSDFILNIAALINLHIVKMEKNQNYKNFLRQYKSRSMIDTGQP
jgi:hypothetical protein